MSVAQWLEHWTVAPGVGGSSPLTHPNRNLQNKFRSEKLIRLEVESLILLLLSSWFLTSDFKLSTAVYAPVAQWIRASASGAEGRRFESSQARAEEGR